MANQKFNHTRVKTVKTCYKLCPSCGNFSINTGHDIFCIVCGEKLIEECPNCKEPIIYPTAKYCPVCGVNFSKKIIYERK
ncbi:MAG: zinc ribbon domain-containing protein [Ignavibacteria bacterium]